MAIEIVAIKTSDWGCWKNETRRLKRVGQRYVAVFDVMGFRRIVENRNLQSLARDYVNLLSWISSYSYARFKTRADGKEIRSAKRFNCSVFSDTLIMWSAPITRTVQRCDTKFLLDACLVFKESLRNGFPLRGGIAFGPCFIDKENQVFVGQPIIDAYETEQSQDWIGVACHPSCDLAPNVERLRQVAHGHGVGPILPYEVPTKRGSKYESLKWTIEWPRYVGLYGDCFNLLMNQAKAAPPEVAHRWDSALAFVKSYLSRYPPGMMKHFENRTLANIMKMPKTELPQF